MPIFKLDIAFLDMISPSFEKPPSPDRPLSRPGRSDIGGQFFNQSLGLFEHPDPGKVVPWFARGF